MADKPETDRQTPHRRSPEGSCSVSPSARSLWAASFVKVNDWLFWEQSVLPATALTTYLNATMGAVD